MSAAEKVLTEGEAGALLLAYRDHEHELEKIREKLKGTPYYKVIKKGKVVDGGVKKKPKPRRTKTPKSADKKSFFNYDSE